MTIRFKDFYNKTRGSDLPVIDKVLLTPDGSAFELLREGKWVQGRFSSNIRIDQATHGAGLTHAHVHGRRGNEIGVVNIDGSGSHGTKCKLHDDDAVALRARGFKVRDDNIVEWVSCGVAQLLLG